MLGFSRGLLVLNCVAWGGRLISHPLDTMRGLQERVASGKLLVKTNSLKGGAYDERNDPQYRVYHKSW